MADEELLLNIDKVFWPKGVVRGLTPVLREFGDRNGNLTIAPQALKGTILVKGPADKIKSALPGLREIIEEHFPDAPVPEELLQDGEEGCAACEAEEQEAPEEPLPPPAPEPAKAAVVEVAAQAPAKPAAATATAPAAPLKPVCGRKRPAPTTMAAPPDLLWECIKTTSSFVRRPARDLQRQSRTVFSAEPTNLLGLHTSKYSGLVSNEALDVRPVRSGIKESIQLVQGHSKASRSLRPKSKLVARGLSKCPKKGLSEIDEEVDAKFYRKELHGLARLKYLKVQRSFKKKKTLVKSRRVAKP